MNIYSSESTVPFTYLIGWSKQNLWYYGVRYAKNCHPSDLWSSYFTSSAYVAKTRIELGEPDIIQIRKTFVSAKKAKLWENKVLQKLWPHKKFWLNRRFDSSKFVPTIESVEACNRSKKNRSPEKQKKVKENISKGSKLGHRHRSQKTKDLVSAKIREHNLNRNQLIKSKISKTVAELQTNRSQEEWDQIRQKKQKTWKIRRRNGIKNKPIKKKQCPFCTSEVSPSNLNRHIKSRHQE